MPSPRLTTSAAIARGLLPRKLLDMVERAEKDVQAMIKAAPDRAASSAKERQNLYDRIKARYAELARELGASLDKGAKTATEDEAAKTARMIPRAKPFPLTKEQMVTALNGKTAAQLVATATGSMSDNAVRHLRNAAVRAFGRAAVEGLNTNETHKALQEEWDKEAGDEAAFRFVDKRGAAWSNARYLQMLIRTTNAEVRRNTMANTFVQNGQDLARISEDSDAEGLCDACARWQGKIVSLTGATEGFPTLEEAKADGLFHPNCTHRLEYLDEEETQEALAERDARLGRKEDEGGEPPKEPPKRATGGGGEDDEQERRKEAVARERVRGLSEIDSDAVRLESRENADEDIANIRERIQRAQEAFDATKKQLDAKVRADMESALAAARKKLEEAQARADKHRPFWEAREVLDEVSKTEFTTSDGVTVRGGVVKGDAADYGRGFNNNSNDGLNCFANAEAQEARCVYGIDVFPFRNPEQWDEKGYEESSRSAVSAGEFFLNSSLGKSPEDRLTGFVALLDKLQTSPNGTFLRQIGHNHATGFVKQDGEVYFVDGWAGKREVVEPSSAERLSRLVRLGLLDLEVWKTDSGEEYTGFVLIAPTKERAKYLANSKFIVGSKEKSGLRDK